MHEACFVMQEQRQWVTYGTRCRLTSKAEFENKSSEAVHVHTPDGNFRFTSLQIDANTTLSADPNVGVGGAAEAVLEQYTRFTPVASNCSTSIDIGYFGVRRMTVLKPPQDGDQQLVRRAHVVDMNIKAGHTYIFTRPGDTAKIDFQLAVPVQNRP